MALQHWHPELTPGDQVARPDTDCHNDSKSIDSLFFTDPLEPHGLIRIPWPPN